MPPQLLPLLGFVHSLCTTKEKTQKPGGGERGEVEEKKGVSQTNSSPPELAVCAFCTAHCNLSEMYLYMHFSMTQVSRVASETELIGLGW